jgi:predicted kinase
MLSRGRGCLILLKGHPGVGKSSLASRIAAVLRCPIIDKDAARDPLSVLSSVCPASELNAISYEIMLGYMSAQLSIGLTVICDSPLSKLELFNRAVSICKDNAARILLIEVECDEAAWRNRLESRGQLHPETHKPKTWAQLQALIEGYKGAHQWTADVKEEEVGCPCRILHVNTSSENSITRLIGALLSDL